MQARLISLDGKIAIPLQNDVNVVGRKRGVCDVFLDHGSVSKCHCLIVKTDGLLLVRDLGSTNGTLVNGQRISRGALLPGDELSFASLKFQVQFGSELPPDAPGLSAERTEVMPVLPEAEVVIDMLESDEDASSDSLDAFPIPEL
ncbi:MAG: FHA domain-containing protein [Planctomycetaceae bacterium]|mgnify:CR=1 FL=1|jgi:pSer/pThr/pTyr-binding forkhead associated (FHA) protein|nr:FHA domain-containing protein [Planctomycetaceae bacterium]MDP7274039.1 FHA domain-containing protein [Planctomycetaceae bacterium]